MRAGIFRRFHETPFGDPAVCMRPLGFAPPPHDGFAFLEGESSRYTLSL
jgi:hypothetical protein